MPNRWGVWRMQLAGTTINLAMAAGCQGLMSALKIVNQQYQPWSFQDISERKGDTSQGIKPSVLLTNSAGQDLSKKLEQSKAWLGRGSFMLGLDTHDRKSEDKFIKTAARQPKQSLA
ncbi:hypothetical protein AAFF_G00093740 [Aldrovandia affinis]|uniref:Uncharacterized protein n=1 Tax=Aldrovandia affinis TaxID=143900 RepID=A0AAD7T2X5_9TELE|nr:hypothetical protein AAFF_G00093740 [Aldrovandia affinis]